ncbi:MAG TPA: VCBS repeat-containing protein [Planctomycetota bacterium]
MRTAALLLLLLPPAPQSVEFKVHYLAVHGRRQDTLSNDYDGDGKPDLFSSSVDFDKTPPERWGSIHLQKNGSFAEAPDFLWPLSDRACALVFGDFLPGGGTEIAFLAEDGVYVHPWDKAGPREAVKLIHAPSFFRVPTPRQIPLWQWKSDFDADGRDDILLPMPDGYRIYFQTAPGVYGRTATLEADLPAGAAHALEGASVVEKPETLPVHFVASVELPRVSTADINGDGLQDLVLIRKDTVTYFIQKAPGVFPSTRPHRVSFRIPTLTPENKKDTVDWATVRFADINQDKLADLVVTRVGGELGLWDSIKTSVYLHLGTGKGNFIADKRIVIDGVSMEPEFIDMNLDGKLDVVTSRLRTDLIKQAASAFVLGDIAISYEVFQFDPKKNTFLSEPVYEKVIHVARKDMEKTGMGAIPMVFVRGDLSGDGRPDLLQVDPKTLELLIHPGRVMETNDGPRIGFDGTAHWRVKVDRFPKGVQVFDVNGDGLNDVILHYAGLLGLMIAQRR